MPPTVQYPALVGCTVSSTGTGDLILDATVLTGPFSHPKDVLTDGQVVTGCTRDNVSYEMGTYTFHSAGGPNGSFSRTLISSSSTAPGAIRTTNPINWTTPGTRNFFCTVPETGLLLAANNLSEVNAVTSRSNLGLGTAAVLDVATVATASKVVQWRSDAKYPAGDASLLTGLPASPIPSGTKMPFYQSSAPAGWTIVTGLDDLVMYLSNNSGTGGGGPYAGGTTSAGVGGWDGSFGLAVGNHTLTIGEMPSHSHTGIFVVVAAPAVPAYVPLSSGSSWGADVVGNTGGGGAHNHPISGASTWRPPGAHFIVCQKT